MQFNPDPEHGVIAVFKNHASKNESASAREGRPIFDDVEVCELRYPGSRNVGVYPATSFSHWKVDPFSGEQVKITYAERFPRQYRQFKEQSVQTKAGTPLDYVPFLTEGKRAELRALNVYTVEALAEMDGQPLKNLGPGGRDLKNRAQEYLADAMLSALDTTVKAELEALKAQNQALKEDMARLKALSADDEFEGMDVEALRDLIKSITGHAPVGNLSRKALTKMAQMAQKNTADAVGLP